MWYFIIAIILFSIVYPFFIWFIKNNPDLKYLMPKDTEDIFLSCVVIVFAMLFWPVTVTVAVLCFFCHWVIDTINK